MGVGDRSATIAAATSSGRLALAVAGAGGAQDDEDRPGPLQQHPAYHQGGRGVNVSWG